jgi:hypothetical protein
MIRDTFIGDDPARYPNIFGSQFEEEYNNNLKHLKSQVIAKFLIFLSNSKLDVERFVPNQRRNQVNISPQSCS